MTRGDGSAILLTDEDTFCEEKVREVQAMNVIKLGRGGPEITEIGLGTWAIGGGWKHGWGAQDDKESVEAIHRSLDLGVNWIDTAAVYGLGRSERVVGEALKGRRDKVILATKCGLIWDDQGEVSRDLRPESIRREIEASLKRLQTDYVDLYQFHWPDTDTHVPVEASWQEMVRLRQEGKVRYCGVSNFDVRLLQRCEAIHHVASLQPPYNMLRREVEEEILPYCRQHGIGVVAYSPMYSGVLTGKFDPSRLKEGDWRLTAGGFTGPGLARNLAFVDAVRPIADRYGKTAGHLAVAWVLMNSAVTSAIVGARRTDQAAENVGGSGWRIEPEDMRLIEEAYAEWQASAPQ